MTTDWMSPAGPDDAWHGDDRADDGGRLDPDTGLPIPAETLDPPESLAEFQAKVESSQDRLIEAVAGLTKWSLRINRPYSDGQFLSLVDAVCAARAAHRQAQEAARQ